MLRLRLADTVGVCLALLLLIVGEACDPIGPADRPCRGELGTENCGCKEDETCEPPLECIDGTCTRPTCLGGRGTQGCECNPDGSCDSGLECQNNFCVPKPCDPGEEGCACYPDSTCNQDLACVAEVCVACAWGTLDCPCPDGSCSDPALECRDEDETCVQVKCDCLPGKAGDQDGDCIDDNKESASSNSDPTKLDSDGDGINDGCEDRNKDGIRQPSEMDPKSSDTDTDGTADGLEDRNHNGREDPGEYSAVRPDSDYDGILDNIEDQNHDGVVRTWQDVNADGCYSAATDVAGESNGTWGNALAADSDRDSLADNVEDKNKNGLCDVGETCAYVADTDCDGLPDGIEDRNHNGRLDSGETDPLKTDSDGDSLADGLEDANHNGFWDVGAETSPTLVDSDGDGIWDGVEDRNKNGVVDGWVDTNADGCWQDGEQEAESDPRKLDTDGDGIADGNEDHDRDGRCDVEMAPNPIKPAELVRTLRESCAWFVDSDCDGLSDGKEDSSLNGMRDFGETDPKQRDTDLDGLTDGCPAGALTSTCEDQNNNGLLDPGETDPTRGDTDGDLLIDGCEVNFEGAPTDPTKEDTDGDGAMDGEEDANYNCKLDGGETDPRVADAVPALGSAARAEYDVCAVQNLKQVTYVQSARLSHDFKLALEMEPDTAGALLNYHTVAFGQDLGGDGFAAEDLSDALWGYAFQSPTGVKDPNYGQVLSRDVYGFVLVAHSAQTLEDWLSGPTGLVKTLNDFYSRSGVAGSAVQIGDRRAPAHDDLPKFRIDWSERQVRLQVVNPATTLYARPALSVRNELARLVLTYAYAGFAPKACPIGNECDAGTSCVDGTCVTQSVLDSLARLPQQDPFYGTFSCPSASNPCYTEYTLNIGAVQRLDQLVVDDNGNLRRVSSTTAGAEPVIAAIVAITPNDSAKSVEAARKYDDRRVRLDDLSGGSALARFAAESSKICESKDPHKAEADMLFVVDDSASMQQLIDRTLRAAQAAQAVLTANSGIIDFRVAMTTTNPSQGARNRCPDECLEDCSGSSNCWGPFYTCADANLHCLKACPPSCSTTCTGAGCPGANACSGSCVDPSPATWAAALQADAQIDLTHYPLPGGGGTFYFEDSRYLDCKSGTSADASLGFIDSCASYVEFSPFFNAGPSRKQLTADAGFLGSADASACTTQLMDLKYDTTQPSTDCGLPGYAKDNCCARLTAACADGPTVLASEMCNLIREMGGLPFSSGGELTTGRRPHSSPEYGTRSARRLITNRMLPALPKDYTSADCGGCDPKERLRLRCGKSEIGCVPCNPGAVGCDAVPLVTVFLSDEEDYWFKDECRVNLSTRAPDPRETDKWPLPALCRYVDGNPATAESCVVNPADPLSYCNSKGFLTDPPMGYDPDQAAWASDPNFIVNNFTQKWRDVAAPQCSAAGADSATSCIGDPCPLFSDSVNCTTQHSICRWIGGDNICVNKCRAYWAGNPATYESQCKADAECRWEPWRVAGGGNPKENCVMAAPINDCQPCKRLRRELEALNGDASGLAGLGDLGPVYSIVRNKDAPGSPTDTCGGGSTTYARGDGETYHDLAIATLGRTQDICNADGFKPFMELLVADIAALSAPYPLSGAPIASTIKIGVMRPKGGNQYDSIPVPRSRSSGFFYDGVANSVAFKSDPIDGQCNDPANPDDDTCGSCSANAVIEAAEICAAQKARFIPRTGDLVYISYRYWRPVPCRDWCDEGESCVRVACPQPDAPVPSACPIGNECTEARVCESGACVCKGFLDICVPCGNCSPCEICNLAASPPACETAPDTTCACADPNARQCDPDAVVTSCSAGQFCSATCGCQSAPGCPNGFAADGTILSCPDAVSCCGTWSQAETACTAKSGTDAATCGGALVCSGLAELTCQSTTGCLWASELTPARCVGGCIWNAGALTCHSTYPPCCHLDETEECSYRPEIGQNVLVCLPKPDCTCDGLNGHDPPCQQGQWCNVWDGCKCAWGGP